MFDKLTDRFHDIFRNLTGRGALSESNIDEAMKEVRRALLEADVNFKVVKEFVEQVRAECLGEKVLRSVTPGQMAVKVVSDQLTRLLGSVNEPLKLEGKPAVIMLIGLQGSGKTTTAGKLARLLRHRDKKSALLAACDLKRPAAIDQVEILGRELGVPVYTRRDTPDVVAVAEAARAEAAQRGIDVLLLDTAGRLQIDSELVQELVRLRDAVRPQEILLVADAALGQEAVSVATHFNDALGITGIILTKLDGDARGGAALSISHVTGRPIKLVGVGERMADLEAFHPERMASRILGMGDIVSLVEKAASMYEEEEARELEAKMRQNSFDLNDFLAHLRKIRGMGGILSMLDFLPGTQKLKDGLNVDEKQLRRVEGIICGMTPKERRRPEVVNPSRRRRIAAGSGVPVEEVNELLNRFEMMRKLMSGMGDYEKLMKQGGRPPAPPPPPGMAGRQFNPIMGRMAHRGRRH
ncbi:MAG: signal recognition particle protein [Lentisphaeria bacterium]|jgi:signal recognition particle subunit SRP54